MNTIGLDLHKRETQLCISHDDDTIIERRIATTRERFTAVLGELAKSRILLEASTESEWVARHLESLGHEVEDTIHLDRQITCEARWASRRWE